MQRLNSGRREVGTSDEAESISALRSHNKGSGANSWYAYDEITFTSNFTAQPIELVRRREDRLVAQKLDDFWT